METSRPVVVKRMPERLNFKQARMVWQQVRPIICSDRPQVVFDLSSVKHLDAAGVDMLLQCMGEVMKRDGDLKLGGISPEAAVILELTRTDRFFEIYDSTQDAVTSFTRFLPAAIRQPAYMGVPPSTPRPQPAAAAPTVTEKNTDTGIAA
jgi:anti-sigma B factor antagonist